MGCVVRLVAALAFACLTVAVIEPWDFGNIDPSRIVYGPDGGLSDNRTLQPSKRQTSSASQCTNGPTSRSCWSSGYDINTDFDQSWPTTGVTRSYQWTVTNTSCNPEGRGYRTCLLVNNQLPGPLLEANWGDMISVTVHNAMQNNGTSIHWHGLRQYNSNAMDGTNGLTECPIAPGQSETYTFQATQFGTSWYHSHYSTQYGDGVAGPIVIHGPASANYDVDLGAYPITDWYYTTTSFQQSVLQTLSTQNAAAGPAPDTILINGTNGLHSSIYQTAALTPGKRYLIRLVSTALDDSIRVSIDNHVMQVISSDFVPIEPIYADSVVLGVGQRYDVIITANQTVNNYWMRATVEGACNSKNNDAVGAQAIFRYAGSSSAYPSTASTAVDNGCSSPGALVPIVPNTVGSESDFKSQARDLQVDLTVPGVSTNNRNVVTWGINTTAIDPQWGVPTLQYVKTGNTSYPVTENLIALPNEGVWVYWIIQETPGGPVNIYHPMHLHGHDFYVLGSGTGTFNLATDPDHLVYNNPTRRDTAFLPAGGWLAIAFPTDNPGAWLMHCHITWHISLGLGVQFLEAPSSIKIPSTFSSQCQAWNTYYSTAKYKQIDSGL